MSLDAARNVAEKLSSSAASSPAEDVWLLACSFSGIEVGEGGRSGLPTGKKIKNEKNT